MWARVRGFVHADIEAALYTSRDLWRLHAMRRTLFVVNADVADVFFAGAAEDVGAHERRRLQQWVGAELPGVDVPAWLAALEARVCDALAGGDEKLTRELTSTVELMDTEITLGSGKWKRRSPVSSRLLYVLGMDGRIVRSRPAGGWRSSQYRWAATQAWFGRAVTPLDKEAAQEALVRRYLAAFGPATLKDVRWWTGWKARDTRTALEAAGAVTVTVDDGDEALLLPDDSEPVALLEEDVVTLLPALDSTTMGWKERDWYLGDHAAALFDRNGNAGPTIWCDGRVVGGWGQVSSGEVVFRLLEDIGAPAADRLGEQAAALTKWMDGVVVTPRFRTPLERELSSG